MLIGSIARSGSQYVVELNAADCYTGGVLAEVEEEMLGTKMQCSRRWIPQR